MTAPSTKAFFSAIRPKAAPDRRQSSLMDLPAAPRPRPVRRSDDFYPTAEPEAIRALLARDGNRIRELGRVWEPACGSGDIVREIRGAGLPCFATDLVARGCACSLTRSFFDFRTSPVPAIITNPPYGLITARDGKARWLRHTLSMPGWRYCALLLAWDWPAGRMNGLGELLDTQPFSYCYLMRWKLDFTGEGQAPQRNAWFVWDRDWQGPEPAFRFLDRVDYRQEALL